MNTLASRMALILVGTIGSVILLLADIFVDYKQSIIEVILPVLILVLLGLVLITFVEFLQEKEKNV